MTSSAGPAGDDTQGLSSTHFGGTLKKKAVFGLLPLWELSGRTLQPQIYVPEPTQDTLLELPEFCLASVVRGATCLCLTVTSLISIQGTAVMEVITEKLRK